MQPGELPQRLPDELPAELPWELADVVVVGSGAGGAALVTRLVERGLKVQLIERGADLAPAAAPSPLEIGRGLAPPSVLTNAIVDADGRAGAMFAAEGSALGGGTMIYTGNVFRFHPSDFHRRRELGDVAGAAVADWPLSYEELEPYYAEIEAEMGVAGDAAANPFEPPRSGPYPGAPMPLDRAGEAAAAAARALGWHPFPIPTVASPEHGRRACPRCGLCSGFLCTQNARWNARGALFAAAATGRLRITLGAIATHVVTSDDGARAVGVELARGGARELVRGRVVVLAANAIQTPRLLLASATSHHPHGLANGSGQVGRNLMTHVMEAFLTIGHLPGPPTIAAAGCTLAIQDFYDTRRTGVALPSTLQPRTIGAADAFLRMVTQAKGWAALAGSDGGRAELEARQRNNIVVLAMTEDLPRADNRVRLDERVRDALGLPIAAIDYAPHALDLEAHAYAAARARELLAAAGARDVVTVPARTARFHIMGTCRMGDDAERAVVDRDGRAHAVDNLYVADASLFVSSAGVNPSLTVQALARRVADRLVARLAARDL